MKNTVGFLISEKENENRRVLTPVGILPIRNKSSLYFQKGYGEILGIKDSEYIAAGSNVCSKEEVLTKDIICEPKIGDSSVCSELKDKTLFGWIHAKGNPDLVQIIKKNRLTVYAWEDMFKNGRHIFWKNNELAGQAAILHAISYYGKTPFGLKVAVLGRGNVAMGAIKILNQLGAQTTVYSYKKEKLFRSEMDQFDIIVNALLWDTTRKDHVIYKRDLVHLKKGAFIIDISCDKAGAIETSVITKIEKPVYKVNGILHYSVDHTPSILYKSATKSIEKAISPFFDVLIDDRDNDVLEKAKEFEDGLEVKYLFDDYKMLDLI